MFVPSHRGRRLRHVCEGIFRNLGDPWVGSQDADVDVAAATSASPRKSDHVIVAVNRVMIGEQRAWRKEEATREENGTALSGG